MHNFWVFLMTLLLSASFNEAGLLRRSQRDLTAVLTEEIIQDAAKDQIPVAVIEVQEPELALQSLQVDTAIQTTDNNAADNNELATINQNELKDATELPAIQTDILLEKVQQQITDKIVKEEEPAVLAEQAPLVEPLSLPAASVDADAVAAVRQATPATPAQSTTPQNFVQFIQASPIGQFFSQLTGGQQQQPGSAANAGATSDEQPVTPAVPGFLNPGVVLNQAQQAVQNAAQGVVNSTTQAFQGLQQLASNIGNQFQSTLTSLSGQNQVSSTDSSSVRPPGPIQSLVNNFVSGNQGANAVTTSAPGQQQGPLQGIISFFQGGNRPQTNPNVTPNNNNNAANTPPKSDATQQLENSTLDDKIEEENSENSIQDQVDTANEVRNSEEANDSWEDSHHGPVISVNDDASIITEQVSNN